MEEEEKKENFIEEIEKRVDNKLKENSKSEINSNNLDTIYKLIDIKKDIANIDYWKVKEEKYKNEIRKL